MAARTIPLPSKNPGLRPADLRRDMPGIASLVEICFADTLDNNVAREMRMLSSSGLLSWLVGAVSPAWQFGFVWVEAGKIVGNISTQPSEYDSRSWLIANVAVHPDYRRRGFARALTEAALQLAREQGGQRALLQVNRNNDGARHLYDGLEFNTLTIRTTWQRQRSSEPQVVPLPGVEIRPSRSEEWPIEFEFAVKHRPEGYNWPRPLRQGDWRPSLWRAIAGFFNGERQERWVAVEAATGNIVGNARIELGSGGRDQVGLLIRPDWGGRLERPLLAAALRRLSHRFLPLYIDHPADEAEEPLRELGFRPLQTLIWMQKDFL